MPDSRDGVRLVCLEGLPGSGKSTAAQSLAIDCMRMGLPARWYYEEERPHPWAAFFDPAREDVDTFIRGLCERCGSFAAHPPAGIQVVEAHLLQGPVGSLLIQDHAPHAIHALVRSMFTALAPLEPRLCYLATTDLPGRLRNLLRFRWGSAEDNPYVSRLDASPYGVRRGIRGAAGLLAFLQESDAIQRELVAACPWPTLVLPAPPPDGPDQATLQALRRLLGRSGTAGPLPSAAGLERYCGEYALPDGTRCTVTLLPEGLLLLGHPRLWRAGNRLLRKAGHRFHAVAWPLEVVFTIAPDGAVGSLHLTARDQEPTDAGCPRCWAPAGIGGGSAPPPA